MTQHPTNELLGCFAGVINRFKVPLAFFEEVYKQKDADVSLSCRLYRGKTQRMNDTIHYQNTFTLMTKIIPDWNWMWKPVTLGTVLFDHFDQYLNTWKNCFGLSFCVEEFFAEGRSITLLGC
ncbi:unnamed protein product [Albugo candida]|uniref:Uncharacterized protein n=1 Tax=Albugo candida TaxID=65357 RepID=A0A024GJU7_9STRA|nr:unnamed protein product [Albugo candida]|eukprot:CCI46792.1 unnamed protein product [Albugo candida]